MPDVVDDPVLVLEGLRGLRVRALVDEADLEALVQEGHHLQTFDHRLCAELDLLEDGGIGPEGDGGAGTAARCRSGHLELARGLPPFSNSITWWSSSRSISSTNRVESALTTETPTPCRPPETL